MRFGHQTRRTDRIGNTGPPLVHRRLQPDTSQLVAPIESINEENRVSIDISNNSNIDNGNDGNQSNNDNNIMILMIIMTSTILLSLLLL